MKIILCFVMILVSSCTLGSVIFGNITDRGVVRTASCGGKGPSCRVQLEDGRRVMVLGLVLPGDTVVLRDGCIDYWQLQK